MKSIKNIKSIVMLAGISIVALFFINISFAANTAKVKVETANLRETADTNSKILELLSQNQEVTILEQEGEWYKVKAQGITGYLRQDVITLNGSTQNTTEQTNTENTTSENPETTNNQENQTNETETPKTNTENQAQNKDEKTKKVAEDTKLKIVPAINATETIQVKKDQEVVIIEKINGWVCIEVETVRGWIREDKLKSAQEEQPTNNQEEPKDQDQPAAQTAEKVLKTLYVNTETVNLRQEANTTSEIVSKLKLNTTVEVYEELDGWYRVKVEGKAGYISASLLSDKKQEVTSRSSTTPRQNNNTNTNKPAETQSTTNQANQATSKKGATVVQTASNYIGSSYVYGASGPNSFDCSGFTMYIYKQFGVSLPHSATAQSNKGTKIEKKDLQLGDIVFFTDYKTGKGIGHCGIYIGGGQFIHASTEKTGVIISSIYSGSHAKRYVKAVRIL